MSARLSNRIANELKVAKTSDVWVKLNKTINQPGVVALGQGFPDYHGSSVARNYSAKLLASDDALINQYSPPSGIPALRQNLASWYNRSYNLQLTEDHFTVCSSATEALYVLFYALMNPGDEVIMFEPFFPWYPSYGRDLNVKWIDLKPPLFLPTIEQIQTAISKDTKCIVLNSPHNPAGGVYSMDLLQQISELCIEKDIIVISDEVYENCLFDGRQHLRIAENIYNW